MACRNMSAAAECKVRLVQERASIKVEIMKLDLASLKSVRDFAEAYREKEW